MSPTEPPTTESKPLGQFVSIVGLLGIFLYFTGWIYRWAYFSFFNVDVKTLDLPLQSFVIVTWEVFFENPIVILKSLFYLAALGLLILIFKVFNAELVCSFNKVQSKAISFVEKINKQNWKWLSKKLSLSPKLRVDNFPHPIISDTIVVILLLSVLFQLARSQGIEDAKSDAISETSSRPVVTLITKDDRLSLGGRLDDPEILQSRQGFRIIGDPILFEKIWRNTTNQTANPDEVVVWRLLIDRKGFFYIFPSLPKESYGLTPPVLVIPANSAHDLFILSPVPS